MQAKQKAIVGSGAFLPGGLTEEVLTVAKTLSDENRWWLLANYLPGLREAEKMQETWIEEIGHVLREEIEPGETLLDFYTKLVPNLSKKNLAKLIEMVSAMSGVISLPRNYEAERIICALVPFLPHGVIRRVIIHQNIDYQLHIKARAQLIPFLEGEELCTVIDSEIDGLIATKDSQIFPDLIPYIPKDERDEQVRKFLDILVVGREIGNSTFDYRTPYLFESNEEHYSPVEKAVYGRINYPSLKKILPSLSKSAIPVLFKHAEGLLQRSGVRKMDGIVILACLLPILPDNLLKRALKVVNQIESRNSSILSIDPDLPTAEKRNRLIVHYLNVLDGVEWLRDYNNSNPMLGIAILANYSESRREDLLTYILAFHGDNSLDRINIFKELANQLNQTQFNSGLSLWNPHIYTTA